MIWWLSILANLLVFSLTATAQTSKRNPQTPHREMGVLQFISCSGGVKYPQSGVPFWTVDRYSEGSIQFEGNNHYESYDESVVTYVENAMVIDADYPTYHPSAIHLKLTLDLTKPTVTSERKNESHTNYPITFVRKVTNVRDGVPTSGSTTLQGICSVKRTF